jgi:hypothetical protein
MAYDVFISFKNSDESGHPTLDSKVAQKLYDFLKGKGLNVFFSNVELEYTGKAKYTEVIDEALDSSRILIAVGTSHGNLNSRWVRYEWESFINDIRSGIKSNAEVFVFMQDMKINELPRALRQQQGFDAVDNASYDRLYNYIKNALGIAGAGAIAAPALSVPVPVKPAVQSVAPLVLSSQIKVGDIMTFGSYDWLVLDVQNGKALLLIMGIVAKRAYDTEQAIAGYLGGERIEGSSKSVSEGSMNAYLDGTLFGGDDSPFSDAERLLIEMYHIRDNDARQTTIYPNIYLLSASELEQYLPNPADRITWFDSKQIRWWLRNAKLNEYSGSASFVDENGNISTGSIKEEYGVRPAMWIRIDSDNGSSDNAAPKAAQSNNAFTQALARLQSEKDCIVYIRGYSYGGQRNDFFAIFLFYASGVVISTSSNTGDLKEETIEDIIVNSTRNSGGIPNLQETGEYPIGSYVTTDDDIQFIFEYNTGGTKIDCKGKIRDDGSIRYTSSDFSNEYEKKVIQYCGAYIHGAFTGNVNFQNVHGR